MTTLRNSFELPPTPAAPGTARRVVSATLDGWPVDPGLRADPELLVTEVVANAVQHAGGEAVLALDLTASEDWLRIGLADGSSVHPVIAELQQPGSRGRGMHLVAAVADRWGSEEQDGGKRVWFDLSPSPVRR